MKKLSTLILTPLALVLASPAWATEASDITKDDFYGYHYFKNALDYDQVAKLESRKAQYRVVARDMKWSSDKLASAVEKYESVEGDVLELAKAGIEAALAESRIKGRGISVEFDASSEKHVVAYVRWRGTASKDVIKDASAVAHAVSKAAPFVSTLSLAAIHPKAPDSSKRNVFEGKIGDLAMSRIQENRIEGYADRLYGRMFEDVKQLPF